MDGATRPPCQSPLLRNDANVQAVRQNTLGITQAAFYAPDTITGSVGLTAHN